jgi:RNA polymerase sigma factor (sigma-70 family)
MSLKQLQLPPVIDTSSADMSGGLARLLKINVASPEQPANTPASNAIFDAVESADQNNVASRLEQHSLTNDNHRETASASVKHILLSHHKQSSPSHQLVTRHSRCLWHLDDDKEDANVNNDPDILRFLIDDISQLPIITNPHQELWLGVQLQAGFRLEQIQAEWTTTPDQIPFHVFLWQTLLSTWDALEQECTAQELPAPRLEAWAAELVTARGNIYGMRRSRMRRFMHRLRSTAEEAIAQYLLALTYVVAETLAVLPSEALTKLVDFVAQNSRLPFTHEVTNWPLGEPELLEQLVKRRVDQVVQTLTTGYLRYTLRIAQGHIGQGLPYADLVQAGFIGLLRAAGKFDYRVQVRFGAYATSWIWQAIGREIVDQGRTVRLPVHIQETLRKWQIACDRFDDGYYEPVLNPRILFHAGLLEQIDYDKLQEMKRPISTLPTEVAMRYEEAVSKARKLCASPVSVISLTDLDVTITFDESFDEVESISELIPDERPMLEDVVDKPIVRQLIEGQIFPLLTDRERNVLSLRIGWGDGQERTLEEIGSLYGLTRERIRQIEARAHKKLENRLVLGLLPNLDELLFEEKLPLSCHSEVSALLPSPLVVTNKKDLTAVARLNGLLSQLPRSDWIQGRSGVQGGQRREQLIAALEQLAAPTHVSDITEQLNSAVESKELEDAHVYALLVRDEEAVILLGQSIFSLVHWERDRAKERFPVLPCCPMPLPDPPDFEDSLFESVLVGQKALAQGLTAGQFLFHMLKWANMESEPQKWFAQTILSAYYLVDLIPYTFYFGGDNPVLRCTLPTASIQELRYHCLSTLTERLVAMPEFWWLFQQNQPVRPADLGEQFADIHPYGLDDVLQRLRLLASLGAAQKLRYGEYRLTPLGEECANRWKREAVAETTVDAEINDSAFEDDFTSFITW